MAKTVHLHSRVTPKSKYNLNYQLGLLPRTFKIKNLVAHLKESGITQDEFYRDRLIEFGSEKSISADRLFIYAKVFDCTIDDLVNHQINAKSIRETMQPIRKPKTLLK